MAKGFTVKAKTPSVTNTAEEWDYACLLYTSDAADE